MADAIHCWGSFLDLHAFSFLSSISPSLMQLHSGQEIVPGFKLVERLGDGMAGQAWSARGSGGFMVAIKVVSDLEMLGGQRELRSLTTIRDARHPNLCPIFGFWLLDRDGSVLTAELEHFEASEPKPRQAEILGTMAIPSLEDPPPNDSHDELERPAPQRDLHTTMADECRRDPRDTPVRSLDSTAFETDEHRTSIRFNDAFQSANALVVAMGLGDRTLGDRLVEVKTSGLASPSGGIELHELMRYMNAAADAIDHLNNQHRIYHCDLKPSNILLVGGQVQVCDFGLARRVETDSRQTQNACGSPAYGAPEMLLDRTYSPTIDQYSLAITYYELRTGRLPYKSTSQAAVLIAKSTGKMDFSGIGRSERAVLVRATQRDPAKRFANCTEFAHAISPQKSPSYIGGQNKLLSGLLVAAAAVLIGGGAWWTLLAPKNKRAELPKEVVLPEEVIVSHDNTGPEDTGPEDTGPEDTGPEDTGPEDTGPENSTASIEETTEQETPPIDEQLAADESAMDVDEAAKETEGSLDKQPVKIEPKEEMKSPAEAEPETKSVPPPKTKLELDQERQQQLAAKFLDSLKSRNGKNDQALLTLAKTFDRGAPLYPLAAATISLLDKQSPKDWEPDALPDIPETWMLFYRSGHAWHLYRNGSISKAMAMWNGIYKQTSPVGLLASDRMEIAKRIVSDTVRSSAIKDDTWQPLRYSAAKTPADLFAGLNLATSLTQTLGDRSGNESTPAISQADSLASSVHDRAQHELVLCHVASQNWLQAVEIEMKVSMESVQLDQARFRIYQELLESAAGNAKPQYVLSMVSAAQRLLSHDAARINTPQLSQTLTENSVKTVLIPTIKRLLPLLDRGQDKISQIPDRVAHGAISDLCWQFASEANRLRDASAFVAYADWLRAIEVTSVIAAQSANLPNDGRAIGVNQMVAQAVEASIQQAYEGVLEHDPAIVMRVVQSYESLLRSPKMTAPKATASKATASQLHEQFVRARLADQLGFLSRDEGERRRLYAESQNAFQSATMTLAAMDPKDRDDTLISLVAELKICLAKQHLRQLEYADSLRDAKQQLEQALEWSREAVTEPLAWHHDMDDRRQTLAISLMAKAMLTELSDRDRTASLELLDSAISQIDQAIATRRVIDLSPAFLNVKKLKLLTQRLALLEQETQNRPTGDPLLGDLERTKKLAEEVIDQLCGTQSPKSDSVRHLRAVDSKSASLKGIWYSQATRYQVARQNNALALRYLRELDALRKADQTLPSQIDQEARIQWGLILLNEYKLSSNTAAGEQVKKDWETVFAPINDPYPQTQRARLIQSIDIGFKLQDAELILDCCRQANAFFKNYPSSYRSWVLAVCCLNAQRVLTSASILSAETRSDLIDELNLAVQNSQLPVPATSSAAENARRKLHRTLVEATYEAAVTNDTQATLRLTVDALKQYDSLTLVPDEKTLRSFTQDWLLVAVCQQLRSRGQSIEIARPALEQIRKEYPQIRAVIDRLLL